MSIYTNIILYIYIYIYQYQDVRVLIFVQRFPQKREEKMADDKVVRFATTVCENFLITNETTFRTRVKETTADRNNTKAKSR